MLLDELAAQRDRSTPASGTGAPTATPPVLTIAPLPVPATAEVGRKEVRQKLAELENVARRNLKSAEEARRVVFEEHLRLERELSARAKAQNDLASLRRELDRLRTNEDRRASQARSQATRVARAEIADELRRTKEELERLRGAAGDQDVLAEYMARLREEQAASATLRAALERAEAERAQAEAALERVNRDAERVSEDDLIELAALRSQLADAWSERDRLAARVDELAGDDGRDAEIAELRAQLDHALVGVDRAREQASAAVTDAEARAREAERQQGRLRREASDTAKALHGAEERMRAITAERDALRERVALAEDALATAREDAERLRSHAVALGDELSTLRVSVAELEAAAARGRLPDDVTEPGAPALGARELEPGDDVALSAIDAAPVDKEHRRAAMAALTSIASTMGSDDFTPRRR